MSVLCTEGFVARCLFCIRASQRDALPFPVTKLSRRFACLCDPSCVLGYLCHHGWSQGEGGGVALGVAAALLSIIIFLAGGFLCPGRSLQSGRVGGRVEWCRILVASTQLGGIQHFFHFHGGGGGCRYF